MVLRECREGDPPEGFRESPRTMPATWEPWPSVTSPMLTTGERGGCERVG